MKQLIAKIKPLVFVLEVCGLAVILMAAGYVGLLVGKVLVSKYMFNHLETLTVPELIGFLSAELLFAVLLRLFGFYRFASFNNLVTVITRKFTILGINWRDKYTTGDLQKLYEWVGSVMKTMEHTLMVVEKGLELSYAGYLIATKGPDFIGIILAYIAWTIMVESLLFMYGYKPNEKKKYELMGIRDRMNADLVLNLNLMGTYPEAAMSIATEAERLNKAINHCCFVNIGFVIISIFAGHIAYDASLLYMMGSVSAIDKVKIFILLASVCDPIFWLTDVIPEIVENGEKFQRVAKMINQVPDIIDGTIKLDCLSENFTIEFEHVSFEYDAKSRVLNDISFTIYKGQRVAFVGESGCGKSTIIKLLTRQLEPTSGRILIDGIDIRKFTLKSLRETFGLISQDVEIMADSLYFNIAMAVLPRKATREEVLNCCKAALRHKVETLPEGLDTFVGDRGVKLSGGLKQLIALARTLISKREILVLDEATAALDNVSEVEVLNAIDEFLPNNTVIAVAHRYSTIADYDVINVIENGRVAESGTYDELIEKQGVFCRLLDAAISRTRRVRRAKMA